MVREMLSSEVNKYDVLYSKEKDWKKESRELKTLLVNLLKNIENDDYKEGIKKIDFVVFKLNSWKGGIEKLID